MGEDFGLPRIFSSLADKGIRLTPDLLEAGGANDSSSASEALVALLTSQLAKKG